MSVCGEEGVEGVHVGGECDANAMATLNLSGLAPPGFALYASTTPPEPHPGGMCCRYRAHDLPTLLFILPVLTTYLHTRLHTQLCHDRIYHLAHAQHPLTHRTHAHTSVHAHTHAHTHTHVHIHTHTPPPSHCQRRVQRRCGSGSPTKFVTP